jgi:hypothetical protein
VRDQLWNPKCNGWFDNCLYPIVIGETRRVKPLVRDAGSSMRTSRCPALFSSC